MSDLVQRLLITADTLLSGISSIVSPKNLKTRPEFQKFAESIGSISTKALKLANFVNSKADDSDSPWSRDLLRKAAQELQAATNSVIDVGNKALNDPHAWGDQVTKKKIKNVISLV